MVLVYMYWQCKHTHNHLIALCPGLPRWAGTRRNLHPLTSMRQRRIRTDSKVHCLWAHPVYGASKSWWRLLDPIKPTYNPSRPDVRLKLTAGAFNQLWIWMPAVLVTIPTFTQNSLPPLLTSSISFRHLLDFMVQVKRTEADAPTICLCATPSGLSVPIPLSPPVFMLNAFSAATLPIYPGLGQAPNNAGLHTPWLGLLTA